MQVRLLQVLAKADSPLGIQELADTLGEAGNEQEVYCLLRRLAANGRVRLTGEPGAVEGIRASIG